MPRPQEWDVSGVQKSLGKVFGGRYSKYCRNWLTGSWDIQEHCDDGSITIARYIHCRGVVGGREPTHRISTIKVVLSLSNSSRLCSLMRVPSWSQVWLPCDVPDEEKLLSDGKAGSLVESHAGAPSDVNNANATCSSPLML